MKIGKACRSMDGEIIPMENDSMRILLLPLAFFYWLGVVIRNWFFDKQILKSTAVAVPVICVGNISAGGVGKTPVVEMLVELLKGARRLAVVSRGYGRRSAGTVTVSDGRSCLAQVEEAGDEPSQIAAKYRDVIVVVAEDRVRGAQRAVDLGAELIVLDDGFQHRYLARDVNIVVLTPGEIFEGEFLLPAGNRREPLSSLDRADLLVVSRCRGKGDFERAEMELAKYGKPMTGVSMKLRTLQRAMSGEAADIKSFRRKNVVAFSGIGNPESFEDLLTRAGARIDVHLVWPDHHWYSAKDIGEIDKAFRKTGAGFIVTTEKDLARLQGRFPEFLKDQPVYSARICQEIVAGEKELDELLKKVCIL
jgi:tetraacyldisaccharide 4'-kinase